MIRYNVCYSQDALSDLTNIFEYIAYVQLEQSNAVNLITEIKNAIQSLSTLPYRHKHFKTLKSNSKEERMFVVKGYAILYEIDEKSKTVGINAIISCKRDLDRLLN